MPTAEFVTTIEFVFGVRPYDRHPCIHVDLYIHVHLYYTWRQDQNCTASASQCSNPESWIVLVVAGRLPELFVSCGNPIKISIHNCFRTRVVKGCRLFLN